MIRRLDLGANKPIWIGSAFILVILLLGSGYTMYTQGNASFLSPPYLLQQLQIASFLGITAAGMMVVILLGHIDLSVPWTLAASAMVGTAVGSQVDPGLAIPAGLAIGLLVGLVNGLGVAFLRVPSMIFTLGTNTVLLGFMVVLTSGNAPQYSATELMRFLGSQTTWDIPHAAIVWLIISLGMWFMLTRTTFGRYIYAIGNREAATYLSGVNTRRVLVGCFVLCSMCAALSGLLITGRSTRAFQGMGDVYLLPSIAAVVLGGTNILGGSGRYLGTVIGVVLIILLQSVLSVMQMPQAGRQIIYGIVIIVMLLVYGRGEKRLA
jgi:ribose transport system permease protein